MRFRTILFLALGFVFLSCEKEEVDRSTYLTPWVGTYEGLARVSLYAFNGSQSTGFFDLEITVSEGSLVNTLDFYVEFENSDPFWIRGVPVNVTGDGDIERYDDDENLENINVEIRGRRLDLYQNIIGVALGGSITRDCTVVKPES